MGRWPTIPPIEARAALMQATGHTVELPQHDAHIGHSAQRHGGGDAGTGAHDAELLLCLADGEARLVGEVNQRQMERVAQFDEADGLLAGGHVHGTAVELRVVGHHAHRMAIQSGEAGDAGATVIRPHLEEAAVVEHGVQNLAWLVDAAALPRHGGEQRFGAALRVVHGLGCWRRCPDVRGQVREEASHLGNRLGFVLGEIHDDAVLHLEALVAEVFLGDRLAGGLFDDLGPGHEHLAGALHHHVEVAETRLHSRQTGHRAEHGGGHRHILQKLRGEIGAGVARQIGAAHLLERLHAAASGVQQPHIGNVGL